MDCVLGRNFKETIIGQYKQQRRWAFGSEGIPYLFFGFLKNKKISRPMKIRYGFLLIEGFWAWGTIALLILFLGWLPLILGGEKFSSTVLAYNLPRMTGNIMNIALAGLLVCVIISVQIILLRPGPTRPARKFLIVFQWIFFPLTFIFFGALPAIDAQTRLMLGKYLGFYVTGKTRKRVNLN